MALMFCDSISMIILSTSIASILFTGNNHLLLRLPWRWCYKFLMCFVTTLTWMRISAEKSYFFIITIGNKSCTCLVIFCTCPFSYLYYFKILCIGNFHFFNTDIFDIGICFKLVWSWPKNDLNLGTDEVYIASNMWRLISMETFLMILRCLIAILNCPVAAHTFFTSNLTISYS